MKEGSNFNRRKRSLVSRKGALSLRCKNEQDLSVFSSLFQDALINNMDFHFFIKEKTFLFVANRFCWENISSKSNEKIFHRVLSGVNIQNVISIKYKNLIFRNDNHTGVFYNLLTIEYYGEKNEMMLVFSQNACVKLYVSKLDVHFKDIEEPYPTRKIPDHFNEQEK